VLKEGSEQVRRIPRLDLTAADAAE
jgi:hypothetical protein